MSNHYHLVIETPESNLVEEMKWLQSTFATRFNRFRNERGHVFQGGRCKSILIGEDRPLLGLINYVYLNPVGAKLCSIDDLFASLRLPLQSKVEKHHGLNDSGLRDVAEPS